MTRHTQWAFVGAHPEDLDDGRWMTPGAVATLDPEKAHNAALIDAGKLIPHSPAALAQAEELQAEEELQEPPAPDSAPEPPAEEKTEPPKKGNKSNNKNEGGKA